MKGGICRWERRWRRRAVGKEADRELDSASVPGLGLVKMPWISFCLPTSFPKMQSSGCCKEAA